MFLKTKQDGSLLEVVNLAPLFDPFIKQLEGRLHAGEELQELDLYVKADLVFPSGEPLPRCWCDPAYPHR
jgi:hypothetical protein